MEQVALSGGQSGSECVEYSPRWLIDELFPNEPEENYMMHCPECDHKMIVKK